jgi:ribosomal protein S8
MTLLIHILNQIKQGAQNKNKSIKIKNISKNPKLCIELLMLLQKQGFIQTFYFIQNQKFFDLCVLLKYNTNNQNTITNLNIYSSEGKLKNIKIRSL